MNIEIMTSLKKRMKKKKNKVCGRLSTDHKINQINTKLIQNGDDNFTQFNSTCDVESNMSSDVDIIGMGRNITLNECYNYVSAFGATKKIDLNISSNPDVVRVTFQNPEIAQKVTEMLQKSVYYKGNKLSASKSVNSTNNKNSSHGKNADEKSDSSNTNQISRKPPLPHHKKKSMKVFIPMPLNLLPSYLPGNFDAQIQWLMESVRLDASDVLKMSQVCNDIQYVLRRDFPGCCVQPFGSIITGLGFLGSDIDCFCNIQNNDNQADKDIYYLKIARKAFYRASSQFRVIQFIPSAKVPIIKLKHLRTNVDVDLNFTSPAGVENSELLRQLIGSDLRILPFLVFIKYWAKCLSLVGSHPHKFSSYSLSLLSIFYLQNIDLPILPSVHSIKPNIRYDKSSKKWSPGSENRYIPKTQNTQNLLSLIEGFFDFYSKFPFDNDVVCTYTAQAISRNKFKNLDLPSEYNNLTDNIKDGFLKNMSASNIMVQDPIELSRNCTVNVPVLTIDDFIHECRASLHVLRKANNKTDDSNIVAKLTSLCKVMPNSNKPLSFLLPINLGNKQIKSEQYQMWAEKINKYAENIVRNVLVNIAKCEYKTLVNTPKKGKTDGIGTAKISFECKVYYDVWSDRSKHYQTPRLVSLDEEFKVSEILYNISLGKNSNIKNHLTSCTLEVITNVKNHMFTMSFRTNRYNEVFYDFMSFIMPFVECQLRNNISL